MYDKETLTNLNNALKTVSQFYGSAQREEAALREELRHADQELSDIEHEIEFRILSRSEKSRLAGKLKEVRIRRRYIKDVLEIMEPCLRTHKDSPKFVSTVTWLSTRLDEIDRMQKNRIYTPRTQQHQAESKITGQHYTVEKEQDNFKIKKI